LMLNCFEAELMRDPTIKPSKPTAKAYTNTKLGLILSPIKDHVHTMQQTFAMYHSD
jgi:hypothetical protein